MRVDTFQCRNCGATAPAKANYVCVECFGPMKVVYDVDPKIVQAAKVKMPYRDDMFAAKATG